MPSILVATVILGLCFGPIRGGEHYKWERLTSAAAFQPGYNYPVFVFGDRMIAFNNGAWISEDGKQWTKTELPDSGLNSAHQKYVQFNGAIYALGSMTGNYARFSITPKILRSTDLKRWETVAETSNLPQRVFYGIVVYDNKMWMLGGFDGSRYYNDVWSSTDGVVWQRVTESAEWSPRNISVVAVFNREIWLLGGGVIDGESQTNRTSEREVWRSADGKTWHRVDADLKRKWRGTPAVFDGKLWLVGANRGGTFESAVWVTENGSKWEELAAPWSPRGAVAAWVFDGKLYMTGGKSSHEENGDIRFVYSNDVWVMGKTAKGGK